MKYLLLIAAIGLGIAIYASAESTDVENVTTSPVANDPQKLASVSQLVGGLESRLRENPDDGQGWLLLAKSYEHLQQTDDAIAAYRQADELGESDEQLLFRLMSDAAAWEAAK